MTDFDWQQASEELAKPLDARAIKPPPQGKFGEYVDGLHVIQEANRIFGRDGWSYTVTRLECASNAVFTIRDAEQVRVAYVCTVQVNVRGVIREGVACGTGNGKPENIGDVIESAVKEAETDALKRALRCFGNTFGLALYEKDKRRRETSDNMPPAPDDAAIQNAKDYLAEADTIDDLAKRWGNIPKEVQRAPAVISAKDVRKAALQPKPKAVADDLQDEIPY